jgi:MFS family permease
MLAIPLAPVIGGPLGGLILGLDGWHGLQGWQWLFLIEGLPAVLLGVVVLFYLTDEPAHAAWLAPEEREWLQGTLETEAGEKAAHGKGLLRSILNPQIILLTLAYLFVAYGVYAIVFFLPLIVKGLGLSNLNVGYVTALPNLFGTIGMILVSRSSDHSGERVWHVVVPIVIAGVAMILAALSLGNAYLAITAFCLAGFGIASCLPVFWNLPTAYLGAATAAGGIAFINSVGNISGYVAPQFMGLLRDRTGTYEVPIVVAGVVTLAAAVLILASGIRKHVPRGAPLPAHGTLLH